MTTQNQNGQVETPVVFGQFSFSFNAAAPAGLVEAGKALVKDTPEKALALHQKLVQAVLEDSIVLTGREGAVKELDKVCGSKRETLKAVIVEMHAGGVSREDISKAIMQARSAYLAKTGVDSKRIPILAGGYSGRVISEALVEQGVRERKARKVDIGREVIATELVAFLSGKGGVSKYSDIVPLLRYATDLAREKGDEALPKAEKASETSSNNGGNGKPVNRLAGMSLFA